MPIFNNGYITFKEYCKKAYDQSTLLPELYPTVTKCKTEAEYLDLY